MPYGEPLSDARTPLADFFRILLEDQRTGCGASREHGQHAIACAVIDGGVLITAGGTLARVELHAIPRNQSGIPVSCLPPRRANQWGHVTGD